MNPLSLAFALTFSGSIAALAYLGTTRTEQETTMTDPAQRRRTRAYMAFNELADSGGPGDRAGVIAAVSESITVEITDEIAAAAGLSVTGTAPGDRAGLRAAFEAAGFEVKP